MSTSIILFEDGKVSNFFPLALTRPVYELKCGIKTLREKVEFFYEKECYSYQMRDYLQGTFKERNPKKIVNSLPDTDILFLNGRILADKTILRSIPMESEEAIYRVNEEIIAIKLNIGSKYLSELNFENLAINNFEGLKQIDVDVKMINYYWDLVGNLGSEIRNDYSNFYSSINAAPDFHGVDYLNKKDIFIGKNVEIKPQVVIDASEGPVIIDDNVLIMPHVVIHGPAYIGNSTRVKVNSYIYSNSSIGEHCKVGGEIEDTIIHSYSNKQHDGFLGHSYLGEWINIGAATNNSDLKNNYGTISAYVNGHLIDTGMQFLGLIMGDHSKTAINTTFNTGTVVGFSCNIFGSGFPKRNLPSFTFGGTDMLRTNSLEKSIEVAKLVMERRNIQFSKSDSELFGKIFELTSSERK
ncbi:MAG: hypothetical protein KKA84_00385 [Bacteroidetes bacterium]|nr:hypothetical protein [Bacteroidota bacterium]